MTIETSEILAAFSRQHGDHYRVAEPLGEGGSGFTHRAHDLRRDIDVCLKFFLHGGAPSGARRDWRITSNLKHPLIADTFSVEHFVIHGLSEPAVAVVSRLIPGDTLEAAIDKFRNLPTDQKCALHHGLVQQVGGDICSAVRDCHSDGHGHGDLSERNVMVSRDPKTHQSRATIIDFDNATYKPELRDLQEGPRIEKDIRSLVRLVGILTFDSKWHDGVQSVLRSCTTAQSVGEALETALLIVRDVSGAASERFDRVHWNGIVSADAVTAMMGAEYRKATQELMRSAAAESNSTAVLESARSALLHRVQTDPNFPTVSMSMTTHSRRDEEAAMRLVTKDRG